MTETTLERDTIRNSYLEAEIASHEFHNTRLKESQDLKLELAKTQAALETLKVTLEVRDNELKIKKEDVRKEKVTNAACLSIIGFYTCANIYEINSETGKKSIDSYHNHILYLCILQCIIYYTF